MTTNAALVQALMGTPASPAWMLAGQNPDSNDPSLNNSGTTTYGTGNLPVTSLDPATLQALQAMGWTGGNPIVSTPGSGGNQDTGPTAATNALSPQFQQWMTQNGLTPSLTAGAGNSKNLGFYNSSSTSPTTGQVGDTQNVNYGNDNAFMLAAALGLGGAGALAAGAGVGAAGVAGASSSGGLSSADLAALYGNQGYGAGLSGLGDVGSGTAGIGGAAGQTLTGSQIGDLGGIANGAPLTGSAPTGAADAAFGNASAAANATNPALIDSAAGTPGYGASAGAAGGGAGDVSGLAGPSIGGGGLGATNPALIDSSLNSAGYGASSAGAGLAASQGVGGSTPGIGSALGSLGSSLLNPNGQGLSGLGTSLLGTGIGALTGSLTGGNTGLLNQVNYQNAATASGQSARTNQTNAQGSLTYTQNGVDAQGNPTYSQNVALNAPYQQNLNQGLANQSTAQGNLQSYNSGLTAAYAAAPSIYGDAGSQQALVQQAQDAAYNSQTSYLDPQYAQQQKQLQAQLANQGVTYGSDAYNAAMTQFGSQQNQAYGTARDSAISQGDTYANTLFNQNLQANQQYNTNLNNQGTNYLNQSSGALNGVVQNPTFATTPTATNYLGAAQLQGNANLNQYNAQTGNANSLTSGLTGLAGAILGNPAARTGIGNVVSGVGSGLSNLFSSGGG